MVRVEKSLNNVINNGYKCICYFACALFLLFMSVNFVSALVTTSICNNMVEQNMYTHIDNPIITIIGCGVLFALGVLVYMGATKYGKKLNRILLIAVLAEYVILGLFLVFFGRTIPAADSGTVFWMGETYANGSLSFFANDSYLAYYPQQIGLVIFNGLMLKVIHLIPVNVAGFHFVKVIYVFITAATVLIQYWTVECVSGKEEIKAMFLYLMAGNFYYIMYSNFLYGEIPSLLFISLAVLFIARLLKCKGSTVVNGILIVVATAFATLLRKNSLIFVIAVAIVLLVNAIKNKNVKVLAVGIGVVAASLLIQPATLKYYEHRTGNTLSTGVTTTSYLAMGMQEGGRASGWYNGYNFNTFVDCNMDTKAVNELAKESINERISVFKSNPGYALSFYMDKYLSQWTDGTYASAQATYAEYGGRIKLLTEVYEGKLYPVFTVYSSLYQNMIYMGALIFVILTGLKCIKDKKYNLEIYLLLIFVFGGFLFHMMWEANSRYIVTYGILLIPYAAAGVTNIMEKVITKKSKRK